MKLNRNPAQLIAMNDMIRWEPIIRLEPLKKKNSDAIVENEVDTIWSQQYDYERFRKHGLWSGKPQQNAEFKRYYINDTLIVAGKITGLFESTEPEKSFKKEQWTFYFPYFWDVDQQAYRKCKTSRDRTPHATITFRNEKRDGVTWTFHQNNNRRTYEHHDETGTLVSWKIACSSKGWYRKAMTPAVHQGMNLQWFRRIGLFSLSDNYRLIFKETAQCDQRTLGGVRGDEVGCKNPPSSPTRLVCPAWAITLGCKSRTRLGSRKR
jgi:hypothetical protein